MNDMTDIWIACPICKGCGISHYEVHGQTEDSVEPIKCERCDGFGIIYEDEL